MLLAVRGCHFLPWATEHKPNAVAVHEHQSIRQTGDVHCCTCYNLVVSFKLVLELCPDLHMDEGQSGQTSMT